MANIITIVIILLCLCLIGVILVQNPKGGGLSSSFGSANQFGGVKQVMDGIEKITWFLAIAIVVLSIVSSSFSKPATKTIDTSGVDRQGQEQNQ